MVTNIKPVSVRMELFNSGASLRLIAKVGKCTLLKLHWRPGPAICFPFYQFLSVFRSQTCPPLPWEDPFPRTSAPEVFRPCVLDNKVFFYVAALSLAAASHSPSSHGASSNISASARLVLMSLPAKSLLAKHGKTRRRA
jgi:hypothetical protein